MKTYLFISGACILFCLKAYGQDFKLLNDTQVDKNKVKLAQNFASNFMGKLKIGETYVFNDEAIEAVKSYMTLENQKAVYQQLKDKFGDFMSVEYAETWIQGSNNSMQIIRLKSNFGNSNKKLEIRVVIDGANKIAGFWVKPWSDMLK